MTAPARAHHRHPRLHVPRAVEGRPVDHRSDIYTFGLILTDLLLGPRGLPTGKTAWEALTDGSTTPPSRSRRGTRKSRQHSTPSSPGACSWIQRTGSRPRGELVRRWNGWTTTATSFPSRAVSRARMGGRVALLGCPLGGTWWLAQSGAPAAPREPVTVLIADFANRANDPVFTGLIEQALAVGVEGASVPSRLPASRRAATGRAMTPGGRWMRPRRS